MKKTWQIKQLNSQLGVSDRQGKPMIGLGSDKNNPVFLSRSFKLQTYLPVLYYDY